MEHPVVMGECSTSNSTDPSKWEYDIFLSFAGKDTRLNFTGHLYEAFIRSGIKCFRDDVDLPKGEDINYLFQAIQGSLCSVLVISENYAKSKWCLDELLKILESHQKDLGRRVFPIFYNVNPADVRYQRNSFGEAMAEHEDRFKENATKVQSWRTALSKIGDMSGYVIKDKHEADIIKNIVKDVWSFLSTKLPSFEDNLVGIDLKVSNLMAFLEIGLDDKRFVGIWGMGGVGKTTFARVVSEKLSCKFEICCFLEKVKDALPQGLISLQKSLLSHLKIKDMEIYDSYQGMQMIRKLLCNKKVFLVLDDIDEMSQLKDLAESPDWFGKGSRIIITTRNRHLLTACGVKRIYQMKTMKSDESLRIFSKKAFNKNYPEEKYLEYSKSVVKYAGGLPLALQALGSYLCGRSEEAMWRDAIDKLKEINPHKNILEVLKISYDGLDKKEKTIFLDIVCLFKCWKKQAVTLILKSCGLNPILGIEVLIEKTLLVETESGELDMHELYEDLGWDIIHQEYPNSRLSKFEDIKEVLENNKGSRENEAIVMGYHDREQYKIEVHPTAFSNMSKIRLLVFARPVNVGRGLRKLSSALKFVQWPSFPLKTLPLPLDELVHIEMPQSNIKKLLKGKQLMNNLKFISLINSPNFTEISDFTCVQSLEHLRLSRCKSLVKIHRSLGELKRLVEVDLSGCRNLETLPSKLKTNSLRRLDLARCKKVVKLPEFGEGMKDLSYLNARGTSITTLPESVGCLTGLRVLYLTETPYLVSLPIDCFSSHLQLVFLSLNGCKSLKSIPRLPPHLIRLELAFCHSVKYLEDELWLNILASLDHKGRAQAKYIIFDDEEENNLYKTSQLSFSLQDLKDAESECVPLRNFFAIMPSDAIPFQFGDISNFHHQHVVDGNHIFECEIEVYIDPNLHDSEWLGIVVFVDVIGRGGRIRWGSKALEDNDYTIWNEKQPHATYWCNLDYKASHCCLMVLELNEKTCWQHLRDDNNTLHIKIRVDTYYGDLNEEAKAWRCRWRMISIVEIQERCNVKKHFNQLTTPNEVKLPLELVAKLIGRTP